MRYVHMSGQEPDSGVTSQQPAVDELAFPDLKPGDAWGESITMRRANKLEAILRAWEEESGHGARRGPFDKKPGEYVGFRLTGADVYWLAARTDAHSKKTAMAAEAKQVSKGSSFIYSSEG